MANLKAPLQMVRVWTVFSLLFMIELRNDYIFEINKSLFKSDFSIRCIMKLCHFPENRYTKKNLIRIGNLIDAR